MAAALGICSSLRKMPPSPVQQSLQRWQSKTGLVMLLL
jgi:hypothetical protein